MAGRYSIQRFANGLLPLLGMQVGGDGPAELEPNLRAGIDTLPFYLADRWRSFQSPGGAVTGVGQFTLATIPQGEQWLVTHLSVQVTQAAATTGTYRFCLNRASFAPGVLFGLGSTASLAAGAFCNLGWHFWPPIILRPGDQWGVICEANTGGGSSGFNTQAIYVPLTQ